VVAGRSLPPFRQVRPHGALTCRQLNQQQLVPGSARVCGAAGARAAAVGGGVGWGLATNALSKDALFRERGARVASAGAITAAVVGGAGTEGAAALHGAAGGWLLLSWLLNSVLMVALALLGAASVFSAASMKSFLTYRGAIGQLALMNTSWRCTGAGAGAAVAGAASASVAVSGPTAPNHICAAAFRPCSSSAMQDASCCWLLVSVLLGLRVKPDARSTDSDGVPPRSSTPKLPKRLPRGWLMKPLGCCRCWCCGFLLWWTRSCCRPPRWRLQAALPAVW